MRWPRFRCRWALDVKRAVVHEVELQTWRWDVDSDPSVSLLRGLKRLEARRRGQAATSPVVVRLLINRVLTQSPNVMARIFGQIAEQKIDPAFVDVHLVEYLASGLGADHAETLVVDGTSPIVMGANVTSDYGKNLDMWDAGFQLTGEVVQSIHADFAKMWSAGRVWLSTALERGQRGPICDDALAAPPLRDACAGP